MQHVDCLSEPHRIHGPEPLKGFGDASILEIVDHFDGDTCPRTSLKLCLIKHSFMPFRQGGKRSTHKAVGWALTGEDIREIDQMTA